MFNAGDSDDSDSMHQGNDEILILEESFTCWIVAMLQKDIVT